MVKVVKIKYKKTVTELLFFHAPHPLKKGGALCCWCLPLLHHISQGVRAHYCFTDLYIYTGILTIIKLKHVFDSFGLYKTVWSFVCGIFISYGFNFYACEIFNLINKQIILLIPKCIKSGSSWSNISKYEHWAIPINPNNVSTYKGNGKSTYKPLFICTISDVLYFLCLFYQLI